MRVLLFWLCYILFQPDAFISGLEVVDTRLQCPVPQMLRLEPNYSNVFALTSLSERWR